MNSEDKSPLVSTFQVVAGHSGFVRVGHLVAKPLRDERGVREAEFDALVCSPERMGIPPAIFMPKYFGIRLDGELRTEKTCEVREDRGNGGATALPAPSPSLDDVISFRHQRHQLQEQQLNSDKGTKKALIQAGTEAAAALPSFLLLEDLSLPFSRPCILDVKMGVQSWDALAPPEKVERERKKWSAQGRLGLRLTGMRVWHGVEGGGGRWVQLNGEYCKGLSTIGDQGLEDGLREYLSGAKTQGSAVVAAAFVTRLLDIVKWFNTQEGHCFFSSSLLFLYEGAHGREGGDPHVDLRMIDFAHTWPMQAAAEQQHEPRDTGYLTGLSSLLRVLQQIIVTG